MHVLVEGLTETIPASARGTSLVLCSLLEARGDEEDVKAQSTVLVGKLYSKIKIIMARQQQQTAGSTEAGNEEAATAPAAALAGALDAARIAASHNPKVISISTKLKCLQENFLKKLWLKFQKNLKENC